MPAQYVDTTVDHAPFPGDRDFASNFGHPQLNVAVSESRSGFHRNAFQIYWVSISFALFSI